MAPGFSLHTLRVVPKNRCINIRLPENDYGDETTTGMFRNASSDPSFERAVCASGGLPAEWRPSQPLRRPASRATPLALGRSTSGDLPNPYVVLESRVTPPQIPPARFGIRQSISPVDELKSRRPRKSQYRLTTLQIAHLELRVAMSVT